MAELEKTEETKVRTAFLPISRVMYSEQALKTRVHVVRVGDQFTITYTVAETEEKAEEIASNYGEVLITDELFNFFAGMESKQTSHLISMPVPVDVEYVRPN